MSLSELPAAHLRLISLCQIMSSEVRRVLPSPAAFAFLRYDFAVRSESNGCDKHSLPLPPGGAPSVSCRRTLKIPEASWYCETTRGRGPAPRRSPAGCGDKSKCQAALRLCKAGEGLKTRRGARAHEQPAAAAAKSNRTAGP